MPRARGFLNQTRAGSQVPSRPHLQRQYAAELQIEWPTVLELVVNLNYAKTLVLTIPSLVLVRADKVGKLSFGTERT